MRVLGLAAFAAALLATPATAGVLPDGGVTAKEVAAALQKLGYKAEEQVDPEGDPMIVSGVDGSPFRILFYRCTKGRCASIQFLYGMDLERGVSLNAINEWNKKRRFARAYTDPENDPWADWDVDFERGATSEAIENAIERWVAIMPVFKSEMRKADGSEI